MSITCPRCGAKIFPEKWEEHEAQCKKIECPDCHKMVPIGTFSEHRTKCFQERMYEKYGRTSPDASRDFTEKLNEETGEVEYTYHDEAEPKPSTPEDEEKLKKAVANTITGKFDQFYKANLETPTEEPNKIRGVEVSPYDEDILEGEVQRAIDDPTIMLKGMDDPLDWALANYLPLQRSDQGEFIGYLSKKLGLESPTFPSGNYEIDYDIVKQVLTRRGWAFGSKGWNKTSVT